MSVRTRLRAAAASITIVTAATAALSIGRAELTAQSTPILTVTPTTVDIGATVTVTITNGPGNRTNWVGLYATTAPNMTMFDWKYLNGLRTAPAVGVASATVTFGMPSTSGTDNVRFFANDSSTLLAMSVTITVQSTSLATISVTPLAGLGGDPVTVSISNGPGNARDWIGR
jgi:hypothetical protein